MPSRAKACRVERCSFGRAPTRRSSPPVNAARTISDPTSIGSGPSSSSAPCRRSTPAMTRVLVPSPETLPPMALINRQRSTTWGSHAALRMVVAPRAKAAAMIAFSVAVTEASSRKSSAACSRSRAQKRSSFGAASTVAPRPRSASTWVSRRRRPMTSPPGGGRFRCPRLASSGPASRIEARTWRQAAGSGWWPLSRSARNATRSQAS